MIKGIMNPIGALPTPATFRSGIEIPLGGMKRAKADMNEAAIKIAGGDLSADSFVKLMGARYTFEANAKVLKVMDETAGTLLNTLA